ncbi:MAG: HAMP domain-containing histidine kinase [Clostridia bacterium]|nr:HAMP domain-containing histidine kinase [Clostridia bacterium]
MFKSIFGRMFWTYAIILFFVFSSISIAMTMIFTHVTEQKQIENISSAAEAIEEWTATVVIEQADDERSVRSYERFLNSWSGFTGSDIIIATLDGDVFESTCGIHDVPEEMLDSIALNSYTIHKTDFGGFYDHNVMTISLPIHYKGNVIGAVMFNRGISDIRHAVLELLSMFAIASIASILFGFTMVYYQAKKISAPIVQINNAAQRIAAGNFGERIDVTSADEVGMLASTFNFMASSIERAERNRRRFISDVSHELRTPMTSISGFVSGMLDGTISDENRDDYLRIVLDESNRLTKLVNDMLEMSKMQSDNFKLDISAFDINALICTCLVSLEQRINDKGLDVKIDFRSEKLMVLADKNQIQRVMLNLLDNAIKFGLSGTDIGIRTSIADGKAHIAVSNIGNKIDNDDMKHLFDRFYKTDLSRERDRTGAGLGLSFVRNILQLHKQKITAVCEPIDGTDNGMITFEFTLETA